MPDLEKVIKGLECAVVGITSDEECSKCSYQPYRFGRCKWDVMADALALLKAQEARVMTPEEVAAVPDGGVIWEEIRLTGICEAMIRDSNTFANVADFLVLDEVLDCDDYLKNYRCWTSRPTDEQRKAVKWDD